MKPRHLQVAGSIIEQAASRAARPPAQRPDAWDRAFSTAQSSAPAQKPTEQPDRGIIYSCYGDVKILSIHRPDYQQEEKPIRLHTLNDLLLGEDWRVKELERAVRSGNRFMKALWIAGAASVAIPLAHIACNASTISASEIMILAVAYAVVAPVFAAVVRYIRKTNLLAEQELQKAREELNAKGEI